MQTTALTNEPGERQGGEDRDLPLIPFRMTVLPNGLTLIVHEDRRHPLIATQLRFNVGSKDEPAGRTGFAHLFEHLMFKASTNRAGNWHNMLREMGGVGVNGTTDADRTNYYQIVPVSALDQLLWMESDRMGHLLGGIDEASLRDEVSVVKNEKRQREGEPYGRVFETIATTLYPREHPYGHTVLGSFEDLDSADLETVEDWYRRWYGASNAILVLAGDIGFEEALAKVEHWFGAMPPGEPMHRVTRWLPQVGAAREVTLYDRVPYRRLHALWVIPPAADFDATLLGIVSQLLSGGSHSRLVRRLVERDRLCLAVGIGCDAQYLSGEFQIVATLAPDADAADVERAIGEELDRFITEGPAQEELDRVRQAARLNMQRMVDDLGGKAEILASGMMAFGSPDGHVEHVRVGEAASTDDIRVVAERWLGKRALTLDVRPFAVQQTKVDPAIRTSAPLVGPVVAPVFPVVERGTLANGVAIRLARRPGTQSVEMSLHMRGGSALDPAGAEGLARITLGMINGGTARRTKQEISASLAAANLKYGMSVDTCSARLMMSAVRGQERLALALMAEMLLEPVFPDDILRQFVVQQVAAAKGRSIAPASAAYTASERLIYGAGHAHGRPSAGMPESLATLTRDMLVARHLGWLDPGAATLVVVGDIDMRETLDMAERAFGAWTRGGVAPPPPASQWSPQPGRFSIPRPGSAQTALNIALAAPEIIYGNEAVRVFNNLFGGSFGARLNANLRERKGWTYGAGSTFSYNPAIGGFRITTEVEADRTMDALAEIDAELRGLTSDRPVTESEIEVARDAILLGLPNRWVSNGAVAQAIGDQLTFGLDEDWYNATAARVTAVSASDIEEVVQIVADTARYTWIAAGDPIYLKDAGAITIDAEGRPS